MKLTSGPLGRGYAATAQTIRQMHELVRATVEGRTAFMRPPRVASDGTTIPPEWVQPSLILKGIADSAMRGLPRRDYLA